MSGRSSRKAAQNKKQPDALHYVGYVDDYETPEMIEKKFQRMEELMKNQPNESISTSEEKDSAITTVNAPKAGLSEDQLRNLFKETSNFSVNMVFNDRSAAYDDLDDIPESDLEKFFSDVDQDEEGLYSEEEYEDYDENGVRKRTVKKKAKVSQDEVFEAADEHGIIYTVKKKTKAVDPLLPVFTRIPAEPLTLSWAIPIKPYQSHTDIPGAIHMEEDIMKMNLKANFQKNEILAAILDIPLTNDTNKSPLGFLTTKQLEKFDMNHIFPKVGFLFVWVEKEFIHQTIRLMSKWDFYYAENLVWVKQNVNNTAEAQESRYFRKSKATMLMFKKGQGLELRHQRNPDVLFDFVRNDKKLTEDKPDLVYHVIETLIPSSKFTDEDVRNNNPPRLLELWAKKGKQRRGWITIAQKD